MDTLTEPVPAAQAAQPVRGPRVTLWVLRLMTTLHVLAVLAQPILAGDYLSGHFDALGRHSMNAHIVTGFSFLAIIAALLYRWPGRGNGWIPLVAVLLLFAEVFQEGMGYARMLAVHIPLGVSICVLAVLLLIWVWRPSARRPRRRWFVRKPGGVQ